MKPDFNLYPARVQTPDGELIKVRVIVADGRVWAFARGPRVVAAATDAVVTSERRGWTIQTADGAWVVSRDGGCGCGDPLKKATSASLLALVDA